MKSTTPIYSFYAYYINWQLNERDKIDSTDEKDMDIDKKYLLKSINASILLNLTALVEGYLKDTIVHNIYPIPMSKYPIMDISDREELMEKVLSDAWSKTLVNFKKIININVKTGYKVELVSNSFQNVAYVGKVLESEWIENWTSIKNMFYFRNKLHHANTIQIYYHTNSDIEIKDKSNDIEIKDKYNDIYNFLIGKNIIQPITSNKPSISSLFNNAVSDYYLKESMDFLYNISLILKPEKSEFMFLWVDSLKWIRERYMV